MKKIVKLNLGCGNEYKDGWINMDIDKKWDPDILADIEKGIPLKSNSVDFIYTKHVMEHIDPKKFEFLMTEIYRVCKKGAKIVIYVPYFSCSITYKTVDHVCSFSYYTFANDNKFQVVDKRMYFFRNSFGYENDFVNFLMPVLNPFFSFLPNTFPLIYERFFCWVFPVEELRIILTVKK